MLVSLYLNTMNAKQIDSFYLELGEKLKKARLRNDKLSQSSLGKMIGLSRTSIVNIESGRQRITLHTLYHLSQILKVNLADLIPTRLLDSTPLPKKVKLKLSAEEALSVAPIFRLFEKDHNDEQDRTENKGITSKSQSK